MKPTAIFLNEHESNQIMSVFDADTRNALRQHLELSDEIILHSELETHRNLLAETEYIFSTWGMPSLSEEEITKYFPRLKAVFYAAGSVQAFARPFLYKNIRVFSAWAANGVPVAEYTVAQIILSNKGFFQGLRLQGAEGYRVSQKYTHTFPGNYNAKVGILGAGMIGSLVLSMLKPYHLKTYVYDPFASDKKLESLGAKRASLEEIFSECQTISNHIANLPTTQRILNYSHFSRMKPNGTFLNTGRGAQVVEEDLIRALQEAPGRTAILDVTFPEPPEPSSPLWTMENVFLTPHIAGSFNEECARMGVYMAQECISMLTDACPKYEVSLKMLETMA